MFLQQRRTLTLNDTPTHGKEMGFNELTFYHEKRDPG